MGIKLIQRAKGKLTSHAKQQENIERSENRPNDDDHLYYWAPKPSTAFMTLLSARYCSALWSNISDCDETYNYWEPTYHLIYGSGFQTWEYSPKYAIRSYAYLLPHTLPGFWQKYFHEKQDKVVAFYLIRVMLALICASGEVFFYRGVKKQFGNRVARILLFCLIFGSGMHISAAAFLPSSFAMVMIMFAYGGWYIGDYSIAIFFTATASLVGWPFSVLLGAPIAFDLVIGRRRPVYFIQWSLISLVSLMCPLVYFDSYYYGKTVFTPFNIIYYNIFGKGGPDLYGTEPWTFYFVNGFLNFNVVFLLALISLPLYMLHQFHSGRSKGKSVYMPPRSTLSMVGLYLWILVFFTRPHKEERFLFPIYPIICLAGAVALSSVQTFFDLFCRVTKIRHLNGSNLVVIGSLSIFALLSVSRSMALFVGYHAPLDVYHQLNYLNEETHGQEFNKKSKINLCVGKEWYRFPSSFFLPERWELKFIRSEFRGQLPKPYSLYPNATKIIPNKMNDMNREEKSRYVPIESCYYLMDLHTTHVTTLEPSYAEQNENWQVLISKPFLDSNRSPAFYRAFYIPFLSNKRNVFANYVLLKSKFWKEEKVEAKASVHANFEYDDPEEFEGINENFKGDNEFND
ncbi:alpha-1,2-mannosyltransferase ALG9-like [Dendronephthya gigantea]|uniref:alpha-1,2-mannosyltransferase ALG9-like n=1 Tax=Dendronephthya gigantea TaxID=151771 RepID=UPI00106DB9DF|nr:alpha-1,2-mannosyltransferase ALG9-like [Dendronephthya gigantea]